MRSTAHTLLVTAFVLGAVPGGASATETEWTYQGQLHRNGVPLTATVDLRFTVWDAASGGSQMGGAVTASNVKIINGLFEVGLDFGTDVFTGPDRWLRIQVREPAGAGSFVLLSPRQKIRATPYAVHTRGIHVDGAGNVGVGDATPMASFTVGDGDKVQISGADGDLTFNDPQASLTFPATGGGSPPMLHMFSSGFLNAERMVLGHSPAAPTWGLQYVDDGDRFRFLRAGFPVMSVDLPQERVGIGADPPAHKLHVRTGTGRAVFAETTAPTGASWAVFGESASSTGFGGYFKNTGGSQGLFVEGNNNWSWTVGNGRGDSAIGNSTYALSTGMALDGLGAGTARIWTTGGAESLMIGTPTDGDVLTIDNGRVGIGTAAPQSKLHVVGAPSDGFVSVRLVRDPGSASTMTLTLAGAEAVVGTSTNLLGLYADDGRVLTLLNTDVFSPIRPVSIMRKASTNSGQLHLIGPDALIEFTFPRPAPNEDLIPIRLSIQPDGDGEIRADIKNFSVPHPDDPDSEIWYASIEGPEAAAYIRGTAQLVEGRAEVALPRHFEAVAAENGLTVQLTPLSPESKGLAIVEKGPGGFAVQELHRGRGSYAFDFLVMAVRKGHEDYQVIRPKGRR